MTAAGAYGGRAPVLAVEGARELRAALKRAEGDAGDLKDAHKAAGDVVAARAIATAPDDPHTPDGVHIATTIRATATKTRAEVRAGNNRKHVYGPTLHYGDNRPSHPRSGATPWLAEAAHDTESTWLGPYAEHLDRLVDRIERATL